MNEKLEIINKWIEKADHDLGTAQITFAHIPEYKDTIAFHCQQAVEKYLKSYLIFLDIPVTRTHNLTFLLSLISQKEKIKNDIYDRAAELEDYAVEIRYPEVTIELKDQDIENAIQIANFFRLFVLKRMHLEIGFKDIK